MNNRGFRKVVGLTGLILAACGSGEVYQGEYVGDVRTDNLGIGSVGYNLRPSTTSRILAGDFEPDGIIDEAIVIYALLRDEQEYDSDFSHNAFWVMRTQPKDTWKHLIAEDSISLAQYQTQGNTLVMTEEEQEYLSEMRRGVQLELLLNYGLIVEEEQPPQVGNTPKPQSL